MDAPFNLFDHRDEQRHELCVQCRTIDFDDLFERRNSNDVSRDMGKRNLRKLQENSRCPFCRLIVATLAQEPLVVPLLAHAATVSIHLESVLFGSFEQGNSYQGSNWLRLTAEDSLNSRVAEDRCFIQRLKAPLLTGLTTDGDCYLRGRAVASELDMALVKTWMRICHDSHGDWGCSPGLVHPGVPNLVVDVNEEMIVAPPEHCRYAALSYVWGLPDSQQLKLTDETQARLESPGGLSDTWEDVPKTISDAMALCRILSIAYLWVDALCMRQTARGVVVDPNFQLSEDMSKVYGAACLTIVGAAGKNSWAGLPGLKCGSRTVLQQIEVVNGSVLASLQPPALHVMESTTWEKRGWTFQERYLSHRLLIFTDHQVFWSCKRDLFCEDIHGETQPENLGTEHIVYYQFHHYGSVSRDIGNVYLQRRDLFRSFMMLLNDYTSRLFTYEEDIFVAFNGVLTALSGKLETSFHLGIPISFFEQGLLFEAGAFSPRARRAGFPSWSWTGWNPKMNKVTGIDFEKWPATRRNGFLRSDYDFKSLTVWYVWDETTGMFAYIEGIQNPIAQELLEISPRLRKCNLPPNINPFEVLVFNTTICELGVYRHAPETHENSASEQYGVYLPQRSLQTGEQDQSSNTSVLACWNPPIGSLELDSSWRRSKGDRFDFIAIAKESLEVSWDRESDTSTWKVVIHTLVIETISETLEETYLGTMPVKIARRIQVFTIDESDWKLAEPKKATVYLF